MLFLGIDQSLLSPGLAIVDEQGKAIQVSHLSVSDKLRGAARLERIVSWILTSSRKAITEQGSLINKGCLEGYSVQSCNRPFDLGEISGAIRYGFLRDLGLDLQVVEPTRLKKYAAGSGLATKVDILHAVKSVWGLDLTQDDEADAYVLAQIARTMVTKTFTRRCQAEVVRDLISPPKKPRRLRTTSAQNL